MKICYIPKKFSAEKQSVINNANSIIAEYFAQGFNLTLRQLYYQFVARGLIANQSVEYGKLQSLMNDARLAGLVDWDAIVDRTRFLESNAHWNHPRDVVRAAKDSFAYDKWGNQANYVEVWVEKDALKGIVASVCDRWDVPYFSCRGYTSVTALHDAAHRLARRIGNDQEARVIHLGDHDPSGIDMTRDISDRIKTVFGVDRVHVHRVALNMNQVEEYSPPPNPAKLTDSRVEGYISRFGHSSWELDALEPAVLARIIDNNIRHWCDKQLWDATKAREDRAKKTINAIADNWNAVLKTLREEAAPERSEKEIQQMLEKHDGEPSQP
jgi:hypothetical protein